MPETLSKIPMTKILRWAIVDWNQNANLEVGLDWAGFQSDGPPSSRRRSSSSPRKKSLTKRWKPPLKSGRSDSSKVFTFSFSLNRKSSRSDFNFLQNANLNGYGSLSRFAFEGNEYLNG